MNTPPTQPYQMRVKELAAQMGKHRNYVHAMKAHGFAGNSMEEALKWVQQNHFVIVRGKARVAMTTESNRKI